MNGLRYYSAILARWISRDPIGERGGLQLFQYVHNQPISLVDSLGLTWADYVLKRNGRQIPKAIGVTASYLGAIPPMYEDYLADALPVTVGGIGVSAMFFPDTCEMAAFRITEFSVTYVIPWPLPGSMPPVIVPLPAPPSPPPLSGSSGTIGSGGSGGAYVGIGIGAEKAIWIGTDPSPGILGSDSYRGAFKTVTFAIPGGGPIGASVFWGVLVDPDRSGKWFGGTVTVGPGVGAAIVTWNYEMIGTSSFDLERELPRGVGKCLCYALILAMRDVTVGPIPSPLP